MNGVLFLIVSQGNESVVCWHAFCRWNEVTRRIEMWISILELNELGEYAAVELHQAKDVNTGGIFQLRQVLVLFLSHSNTQSLEFLHYLTLCSLICFPPFILFPLPSPFPFLVPISTSLPHGTLTSTGSFPESASHSKTCTAFRYTATYGWSHPVSIYWLCDCPVHQAPKRAGQLSGKTNWFETVLNEID